MAAKRKYELNKFLEVLITKSMSTGVIARKLKCCSSTALRYLRELKKAKQVIEQRISNTINLWKLTGKRILLIDVDSKIPNFALMKISAYHKSLGGNVLLTHGSQVKFTDIPDRVYASIIYKKNKHVLDYLLSAYPGADIDIGGSGYDLRKELPPEIECMQPDYSLYLNVTSLSVSLVVDVSVTVISVLYMRKKGSSGERDTRRNGTIQNSARLYSWIITSSPTKTGSWKLPIGASIRN